MMAGRPMPTRGTRLQARPYADTQVEWINGVPVQLDSGGVPLQRQTDPRAQTYADQAHPAELNIANARQLNGAWRGLQRQYPQLTRGVDFAVNPKQNFEGTTTQNVTPQGRPLLGRNPLISMGLSDSHGPMDADPQRNDYAVAHELGHANERNFIHGPADADTYTDIAGIHNIGGARDQFGMPYQTASGTGTPANELYAADFGGALGRRWPDGEQISGPALQALQYMKLLPKGGGYGVGASGFSAALPSKPTQNAMVAHSGAIGHGYVQTRPNTTPQGTQNTIAFFKALQTMQMNNPAYKQQAVNQLQQKLFTGPNGAMRK